LIKGSKEMSKESPKRGPSVSWDAIEKGEAGDGGDGGETTDGGGETTDGDGILTCSYFLGKRWYPRERNRHIPLTKRENTVNHHHSFGNSFGDKDAE
jgi:hypothetical protein